MKTIQSASMEYIEKEVKKTRISLGQAERRSGVTPQELKRLNDKIKILEWMSYVVRNTDDEEGQLPVD